MARVLLTGNKILRASPFSLGGVIFAGFFILGLTLFVITLNQAAPHPWFRLILTLLFLAFILYVLDGLSERLSLAGKIIEFRSMFRPAKQFDLREYRELSVVHEGLNQEKGIVSIVLSSGEEETRISLGPFWRQRELESFLVEAAKRAGVVSYTHASEKEVGSKNS